MLRFLRQHFGSQNQDVYRVDRLKYDGLQEYIHFSKLMCHGFPQKSSCCSLDFELGLLAIGTKDGRIKIVGSEKVEWSGHLHLCSTIRSIQFIQNTGCLMLVSEEPSSGAQNIHKVQIDSDKLHIETVAPSPLLKKINCSYVISRSQLPSFFLIGTISGNLYNFSISSLNATDFIVYDDLMEKDANELDSSQRSITYINHDGNNLIIVVVNSIYLVIYDIDRMVVAHRMHSTQPISSAEFSFPVSSMIVVAYANGSYSTFNYSFIPEFTLSAIEKDMHIYDDYPTTSIPKASLMIPSQSHNETLVFVGGMPKASCGDRYAITVKNSDAHVVFDFDSPIIDFQLMANNSALFVLCEQELVVVDLLDPNWKSFPLPYLYPLHFSPISCLKLISNVQENVYLALCDAGVRQLSEDKIFSLRPWPLMCGYGECSKAAELESRECAVLITGHENGCIAFWKANSVNMKPLLIYNAARDFEGYFEPSTTGDADDVDEDGEDNWPPFKKAGLFETFCDDPRFAIQKIAFDESTGNLVVGGRAGHVIVYEMSSIATTLNPLTVIDVDIVGATQRNDNQKGPRNLEAPLPPRKKPLLYRGGIRPAFQCMIQLKPPVPIQTLAWNSETSIVAIGIEFGYIVCNMEKKQVLSVNSLLPADDIIEIVNNDGQLSRFKSVKKTIRQSFRRKKRAPHSDIASNEDASSAMIESLRPTEREITARPKMANYNVMKGDVPPSSVRMLRFLKASMTENDEYTILLVGTSGGIVYMHKVEKDQCKKIREIRLKHEAPIIHSEIMDGVLYIFSEEQIRCFFLPSLRPTRFKYKLMAIEGSRISKVEVVTLKNTKDRGAKEQFIAVISNRGEIFMLSPWNLKKLARLQFTKATDGVAINSASLAKDGALFWLRPGGSEFQRSTIAACSNYGLISPFRDRNLLH